MSPRVLLFCGLAGLPLSACSVTSGERASVAPAEQPVPAFDATTFVPAGFDLVRVARGDLNGDGREDAVVVTMPDDSDPQARFARRTLSIVVTTSNGAFALTAQNSVLAGCQVCGGSMGDGLAEVTITDGTLVVVNEGGIRARWSDVYTFRYNAVIGDALLVKYSSAVSSQVDQLSDQIELAVADFGVKRFSALSQDDLPRATIP